MKKEKFMLDRKYCVRVKNGLVWVKIYVGSYDLCILFSGTLRNPCRVELNI